MIIPKKVFKCCSITDKVVFIFLNIYFIENNFEHGNKVTWLSNRKIIWYVISVNIRNNKIKVRPDNKNISFVDPKT